MNNVTWDWGLFEFLNFDGPAWLDTAMTKVSGTLMWIPLYILIIYLVWRRHSWRGIIAFAIAIGVAILLADVVAGIFKHQGPLADLWPSFPARLRPQHTPEGLDFVTNGYNTGYIYGTVSGHTSTITAIAILSAVAADKRWFTIVMACVATLICYSRIYLACHFPQDILLGATVGIVAGVIGVALFKYGLRLIGRKA
ncbi:MAG: phosphatase PAP2 family protein [Alistipes sp.]|nr:phosphatase PAP2 family protein [Alistipes sp.]